MTPHRILIVVGLLFLLGAGAAEAADLYEGPRRIGFNAGLIGGLLGSMVAWTARRSIVGGALMGAAIAFGFAFVSFGRTLGAQALGGAVVAALLVGILASQVRRWLGRGSPTWR